MTEHRKSDEEEGEKTPLMFQEKPGKKPLPHVEGTGTKGSDAVEGAQRARERIKGRDEDPDPRGDGLVQL